MLSILAGIAFNVYISCLGVIVILSYQIVYISSASVLVLWFRTLIHDRSHNQGIICCPFIEFPTLFMSIFYFYLWLFIFTCTCNGICFLQLTFGISAQEKEKKKEKEKARKMVFVLCIWCRRVWCISYLCI